MEIDDYQLIELVRKNNVIYDKNHGQHKNKVARLEAFKNISAAIGAPADICETRWCLLRNRFCCELRQHRGLQTGPPRRPWPLFDRMKFLSKFIYPRKTRSMLVSPNLNYNSPYQVKPDFDTSDDNNIIENEPPEEIETTPSLSLSDDDYNNAYHENNTPFPVVTHFEEDNEDVLFGKMIAKYIQKIKDVDKKIQIKIKIMNILKSEMLENV